VTPRQSNDMAETEAPAALLPGVLHRSPTSKLEKPVLNRGLPGDRSVIPVVAFEPAKRGGSLRMTGAASDRQVGQLREMSEISDPIRPQATPL
jgi:hypothetical protein